MNHNSKNNITGNLFPAGLQFQRLINQHLFIP